MNKRWFFAGFDRFDFIIVKLEEGWYDVHAYTTTNEGIKHYFNTVNLTNEDLNVARKLYGDIDCLEYYAVIDLFHSVYKHCNITTEKMKQFQIEAIIGFW